MREHLVNRRSCIAQDVRSNVAFRSVLLVVLVIIVLYNTNSDSNSTNVMAEGDTTPTTPTTPATPTVYVTLCITGNPSLDIITWN